MKFIFILPILSRIWGLLNWIWLWFYPTYLSSLNFFIPTHIFGIKWLFPIVFFFCPSLWRTYKDRTTSWSNLNSVRLFWATMFPRKAYKLLTFFKLYPVLLLLLSIHLLLHYYVEIISLWIFIPYKTIKFLRAGCSIITFLILTYDRFLANVCWAWRIYCCSCNQLNIF